MLRRRVLLTSTIILGLAGLSFALWPFLSSFAPTATAGQSLPHLDVRDLQPGYYAYFRGADQGRWRRDLYLVIRQKSGSFTVLEIGTNDDKFIMPDFHYWGWSGSCRQFSLPLPEGRLPEDGLLRCFDDSWDGSPNPRWRWDSEGNNLSGTYSGLYRLPFVQEGNELVVGKTPWPRAGLGADREE